jgi:DNA-binding Xre family transcriptional regulator
VKWNMRLVAAKQDIWKASDLQRRLTERGLEISAGKMSKLWSGRPVMLRLDDLDVICAVLACTPNDLLIPEPDKVAAPTPQEAIHAKAAGEAARVQRLRPRRTSVRSLPPA